LRITRLLLLLRLATSVAAITSLTGVVGEYAQRPTLDASLAEARGVKVPDRHTVRISLRMPAGWHIGGPQPTAIGLPTRLGWHLPRGWRVLDERWPPATREIVGRDTSFTYDHPVTIDVLLAKEPDAARNAIEVVISYGLCREVCVPGQVALSYSPK